MKNLFIIGCAAFSSGCTLFYEPYPAWERAIISQRDVPTNVWRAYLSDFPTISPIQIEQSTFGSRNLNYPKSYRFWITDGKSRIYDESGATIGSSHAFPTKMMDSSR
jgi:hypothetical protein